jgi:hypothetical protein
MIEWMCFVFLFIHTESSKLKIYQKTQKQDQVQIEMFIQDIKQNPDKMRKLSELRKKNEK